MTDKYKALREALEVVEDALQEAYNSARLVCCCRSGYDCCGSPAPEWEQRDMETMDMLGPVQKGLSEFLKREALGGGQ